jgi:hypothetical protein
VRVSGPPRTFEFANDEAKEKAKRRKAVYLSFFSLMKRSIQRVWFMKRQRKSKDNILFSSFP